MKMKKNFFVIIWLLIFMPFLNVGAISCYKNELNVGSSFPCSDITEESLSFIDYTTDEDYSSYFSYTIKENTEGRKEAQITIDNSLKFSADIKNKFFKVIDGSNSTLIIVKNSAYVEPTTTTTTTTTTTKDPNIKTLTVTLDPNDGNEKTTKTCDVKSDDTTCNITLPKIDKNTFNGWGTAASCKEGNSGSIKVEKDITYYACYTDNNISNEDEEINDKKVLYLKSLSLTDEETSDKIDFGTFSIKKMEYSFEVLNDVININVDAKADEGINVSVTGNENLSVGENTIVITLTDENNNQNIYELKVTRLESGESINDIHYLKSLVIGGYKLDFNKNTFIYDLVISSDIEKLEITAIPEKDEDSIEIENNENLVDGSEILINVAGENEEITKYTINIAKENNVNYLLLGGIGLLIILIILLIILIIIKSKKKKKSKSNKNNEKIEVLNI